MFKNRTLLTTWRVTAVLAVCVIIAAHGCESTTSEELVTQTVGATGGTVSGLDGMALVIPAGALASDVVITITRESGTPTGLNAAGDVFKFEPDGLAFASPVTVTLPYDAATATGHESDINIFSSSTLAGPWTALSERSIAPTAHTITAQTTHFCHGVVAWVLQEDADTDTEDDVVSDDVPSDDDAIDDVPADDVTTDDVVTDDVTTDDVTTDDITTDDIVPDDIVPDDMTTDG